MKFFLPIFRMILAAALLSGAWACGQGLPADVAIPAGQWHTFEGADCALPNQPQCNAAAVTSLSSSPKLWMRAEIELPAALRGRSDLGVLVGAGCLYRLYVNGQRIGASGDFETRSGPVDGRAIFPLPRELTSSGRVIVAYESLSLPSPDLVGAIPPTRIGPVAGLASAGQLDTLEYLRAEWLHYLSYLMVFAAGLLFLLFYLTQRQSREYLWLSMILIGLAALRLGELACVIDLGAGVKLAGLNDMFWNVLVTPAYVEFAYALSRRRVPRPMRVVQLVMVAINAFAFVLFLPLSPAAFLRWAPPVFKAAIVEVALLPFFSLVFLVPLPECWRSRDPEMKWIGAALTFIAFEETARYTGQLGVPTVPQDILVRGVDVDLRGLSFLLFSVIMIAAMTVRYRRMQGQAQSLEMEIAAAKTVQQVLIPEELPKIAGLTIESVYQPARQVGGDFFQVIEAADGAALVVLGDVSGKGMQAAMTVSLLVGTVRTEAEHTASPGELMRTLNRRSHGRRDSFTTCLVLHVARTGEVTAANAGHLQPYIDGREVELMGGLPLGFDADMEYAETYFLLRPGERLTLLTDGVVEAVNLKRELFGFERTAAISVRPAQAIAEEARLFGLPAAQSDDITVLTLMRR